MYSQNKPYKANGTEKRKYTVRISRLIDNGYGVQSEENLTMDTWAVSDKKAISNIRYRRQQSGALSDTMGPGSVVESYEAVPA